MEIKKVSFMLGGAIIGIVVLYGLFLIFLSWPISFGNIDKAGVFGDSFGALTSLFSGLAFAGIILTIFLQREELQLQRKELELTRGELRNQNEAIKKQNFENTFFQMLRLHNDIVNAIDISKGYQQPEALGRDCFVFFYKRIQGKYREVLNDKPSFDEEEVISVAYGKFWDQSQQDLGHYFRYLYTIFKFLKLSDIGDKRLYSNIVRAQLSDQELLVLFYNCLCVNGKEKFKPLVEEFALFDNLPVEQLLDKGHRHLFLPGAFG